MAYYRLFSIGYQMSEDRKLNLEVGMRPSASSGETKSEIFNPND
ncbi:hypothetical protein D1AOALGA4SA_559 [Olavius algarvensis Delta 1 endosymbiont]|nr:hypothetical protein D1AOALGA4SA_559 [Olavius algarvensis Delta 1 endosymbiont]